MMILKNKIKSEIKFYDLNLVTESWNM